MCLIRGRTAFFAHTWRHYSKEGHWIELDTSASLSLHGQTLF